MADRTLHRELLEVNYIQHHVQTRKCMALKHPQCLSLDPQLSE